VTSRDFCYWLQGYLELKPLERGSERLDLSAEQAVCIRQHLALVFKHEIDPSAGSAAHQLDLNQLHNGLGQTYCAPAPQQGQDAKTTPSWAQGPRPDGTQARC